MSSLRDQTPTTASLNQGLTRKATEPTMTVHALIFDVNEQATADYYPTENAAHHANRDRDGLVVPTVPAADATGRTLLMEDGSLFAVTSVTAGDKYGVVELHGETWHDGPGECGWREDVSWGVDGTGLYPVMTDPATVAAAVTAAFPPRQA